MAQLFERASQRDRTYTTHELFEVIVELTQDPTSVGAADQLLRVGVSRVDEYWHRSLRDAGFMVELEPIDRAGLSPDKHFDALGSIIPPCDCGNYFSVSRRDDTLVFDPLAACDTLRDGAVVTAVEGHALGTAAGAAHAAAVAKMRRGQPVSLRTDTGKILKIRCDKDSAPPYSSLLGLSPKPTSVSERPPTR